MQFWIDLLLVKVGLVKSLESLRPKLRSGEMFIACSARNGRQLLRSAMFSDTIHLATKGVPLNYGTEEP